MEQSFRIGNGVKFIWQSQSIYYHLFFQILRTNDVVATSVARYFFDVSDWDNSKWIVPLGSSGHPGSTNYSDQGLLWKDDKVISMQYSWLKIKDQYVKQEFNKSD